MTLKELFPRMRQKDRISGPWGYIELSPNEEKLYVVVDIKLTKTQHCIEKVLNDPKWTLTNDGKYCFWLNFSDKYRALQLIGKHPDRRG